MPRKRAKPAGAGLAGTPSANRTDLANQTPTGLPYGEAGALAAAQQAVPIPAAVPGAGAGATPPPAQPSNGPTPEAPSVTQGQAPMPPGLQQVLAEAAAMAPPSGSLSGPSKRPNEPVTAGLPSGPGPGPEVLGINQPGQTSSLVQTLQAVAQASGSGMMANLAAQAAQAGA